MLCMGWRQFDHKLIFPARAGCRSCAATGCPLADLSVHEPAGVPARQRIGQKLRRR